MTGKTTRLSFFVASFIMISLAGGALYGVTLPDAGTPYTINADIGDEFTLNPGWQITTDGVDRTASGTVNINADGLYNITVGKLTHTGAFTGGYGFTKTGAGTLAFSQTYQMATVGGQNATLQASTGTILFGSELHVGTTGNAVGNVKLTGTASVEASHIWLGRAGGSTANFTLADKASLTVTRDYLVIGESGTAVFNMTGGTLSIQGSGGNTNLYVSNYGGSGYLNVSGGTINVNGDIYLGERGLGKLNLSGNAKINLTGALSISTGHAGASNGIVYQTGGTINASGGIIFNAAGQASKGAYYLAGGTLNTSTISANGFAPTFTVTGGTLNATDIRVAVNQYGGSLSPGGDGALGQTTIHSAYVMGDNPTPGVSHINLAYMGLASQSSTDHSRPASKAFDGVRTGDDSSHTGANNGIYGNYQWLQVDLGDVYEIAKADVYYRSGYLPRIVGNGNKYYLEVASDESKFGTTNAPAGGPRKDGVWESSRYDTYDGYVQDNVAYPQTMDFSSDQPSGRYVRFVRDLVNPQGGDNDTINMSELEIFAVEDIVANVLHIDITAGGAFDKILFDIAAGGSLTLGDNVILELEFIGEGAAGRRQVLNDDLVAMLISTNSSFADVVIASPGWMVLDGENILTSGGFVTLGAANVPEPATWLMLMLGVLGWAVLRRQNAKR